MSRINVNHLVKILTFLICSHICVSLAENTAINENNNLINKDAKLVSINLCSDRVLQAIAKPEQIAALSKIAFDPNLYLTKPAKGIKSVSANINELLPFYSDAILIDKNLNYQLYQRLKKLGFNLIDIQIPTNENGLITLVKKITELTNNYDLKDDFLNQLSKSYVDEKTHNNTATMISEGLVLENGFVAKQLFKLLGFKMPVSKSQLTKLSIEKLLLLKTDYLIIAQFIDDKDSISNKSINYSKASSLLQNPIITKNKIFLRHQYKMLSKYQICFDQGIWQGAEYLKKQIEYNLN